MAEKCETCGGSGKVEEDGKQTECPTCHGTGEAAAKEPPKD
jgi:DnaJ-class molecular chaperone